MAIGDIGFCPSAHSLSVFFGLTPASVSGTPVAEEPVVVVGRTLASPDELRSVGDGTAIAIAVCGTPASGTRQAPATPAPAASAAPSSAGFGERKLSQSEIDVLVQQLLAEKNKSRQ